MGSKTTFSITLPDGTVRTRTSTSREYAWVVAATRHEDDGAWWIWQWSSRRDLAERAASNARTHAHIAGVRVLPVETAVTKEVKQGTPRPFTVVYYDIREWPVSEWRPDGGTYEHRIGTSKFATLEAAQAAARKRLVKLQAENPTAVARIYHRDEWANFDGSIVAEITTL